MLQLYCTTAISIVIRTGAASTDITAILCYSRRVLQLLAW